MAKTTHKPSPATEAYDAGMAMVLTPAPLVAVLAAGFAPRLHPSVG